MSKRKSSNVVSLNAARKKSQSESLDRAQQKVYDAWETQGKRRYQLAKEALALSENCADAYLLLAEQIKDSAERIALYRKAIAAAHKVLGRNWEQKYQGIFWLEIDTRPLMRAMARLAMDLQCEDELEEALTIYRKLLALNPRDNQGIRYLIAGCLYEAGCDAELAKVLADNKDDDAAAMRYTEALYVFKTSGDSTQARKVLLRAFECNPFVPIFLSEVVEMPEEAPSTIGFGDEREAIAYVFDNGYLWDDVQSKWMAEVLGDRLYKLTDDEELVGEVIKALKCEWDN
jgi:tetratricopeptide (TPR) repeat protein